jgi:hypothetical protein
LPSCQSFCASLNGRVGFNLPIHPPAPVLARGTLVFCSALYCTQGPKGDTQMRTAIAILAVTLLAVTPAAAKSAKSYAPGHYPKGIHGASSHAPGHEKRHHSSARMVAPGHLKH